MSSASSGGGGPPAAQPIHGDDVELNCTLCKHDHPVNTTCATCGHARTPTPPVFRYEHELARPPNMFAVHSYGLTDAQLRDVTPVDEADRQVCGSWAMEKAMRGRLRDELAKAACADQPTPAVATALTTGAEAVHEQDASEVQSRHIVGKIGDACVSTLRWRVIQAPDAPGSAGSVNVALLDRLFVLPFYRRRRVARTTLLNCLVDISQVAAASGQAIHRVSVVIPSEPRLAPVHALLTGMAFSAFSTSAADLSGVWGAPPPGAGAAQRQFVELSLPFASVMPLLQAAHAAAEGVRPARGM